MWPFPRGLRGVAMWLVLWLPTAASTPYGAVPPARQADSRYSAREGTDPSSWVVGPAPRARRHRVTQVPAAVAGCECRGLRRSLKAAVWGLRAFPRGCGGPPPLAAGLGIRGSSCVSPGHGWELSSRLQRGPFAPGSTVGLKRSGGGFTGQQRASAGVEAAPSPGRLGGLQQGDGRFGRIGSKGAVATRWDR